MSSRRSTCSRDASCGSHRAGARRSRSRAAIPSSSRAGSATRVRGGSTSSTSTAPSAARRRSSLVERVASAGGLPLQVGGGYRSLECDRRGDRRGRRSGHGRHGRPLPRLPRAGGGPLRRRLVVAIDVRDGEVAVEGWTQELGHDCRGARRGLRAAGVQRLLVTSTARDGSLAGPDVTLLAEVLQAGLPVIAAGGISSIDDLLRASGSSAARAPSRAARCSAGRFTLPEAHRALEG